MSHYEVEVTIRFRSLSGSDQDQSLNSSLNLTRSLFVLKLKQISMPTDWCSILASTMTPVTHELVFQQLLCFKCKFMPRLCSVIIFLSEVASTDCKSLDVITKIPVMCKIQRKSGTHILSN